MLRDERVAGACSSHGSDGRKRETESHKAPKELVHFHFGSRPLDRTSHVALPRVKRERNTLHQGEAWRAGPSGRVRNWGLSPTPP